MFNKRKVKSMERRSRMSLRCLAIVVCGTATAAESLAQIATEQQVRQAEARELAGKESAKFSISLNDDRKRKLVLNNHPVQFWTNDVNGEFYGSVFLWMLDGRPQVVGSLYRSYSPYNYFAAELQSLSEHELSAVEGGEVVWQPPVGVSFRTLTGREPPMTTALARGRQMKTLARRFTGELIDLEKVARPLQVLPQPLYRYENTPPSLLDGAVFSLGSGTDPEVLLLIEARRNADAFQWQYALARLSIMQLRVHYDDQPVWSADVVEWPYEKPRESYTILRKEYE